MADEKRLIDVNTEIRKMRDALAKNKRNKKHLVYWVFDAVISVLEKAPTVDAVEVVYGEWKYHDPVSPNCFCSVCQYDAPWDDFGDYHAVRTNYCPNCGAKMDGDENV